MNGRMPTHDQPDKARTRHRPSRVVLCVLLVLVSWSARAYSLASLLDQATFSQPERDEVVEVFETAGEAGIREELLLPRLAEGIAKRVPAARIAARLRSEVIQLLEAKSLLMEVEARELLESDAIWARAANLLDAGVGEESVQALAIAAVARPETFRPASALLVSMIEWGLDEPDAAAVAAATVASELDTSEYPVVLDLLIEGRVRRAEVDEMVRLLLEELPEAESTRELRRSLRW